ncbi:MAG: hypothetical protein WC710_05655 [Gallionella sp.]
MGRLIRQAIYFLMITLVINAGGWTFNKEAVADVWFDEQRSLAMEDHYSSSESQGVNADVSPQSPCNHWCHAAVHFMGLLSQSTPVMPEFVNEYSIQQSKTVQLSSPDGLFRPPRLFS